MHHWLHIVAPVLMSIGTVVALEAKLIYFFIFCKGLVIAVELKK